MDEIVKEEQTSKVFTSKIPIPPILHSHLYELFEVPIIKPALRRNSKTDVHFMKNTKARTYVYKKYFKRKVKTIGDIRKEYEDFVFKYLTHNLEQQKKLVYDSVNSGLSCGGHMINQYKRILNASTPISRMTWKMLTSLNIEGHIHSKQYVLWNGINILVNGSQGGPHRFLSKFDVNSRHQKYIQKKNNGKYSLDKVILNTLSNEASERNTLNDTRLEMHVKKRIPVELERETLRNTQNSRSTREIIVNYSNSLETLETDENAINNSEIEEEIKCTMDHILTAVELNVIQDSLVLGQEVYMNTFIKEKHINTTDNNDKNLQNPNIILLNSENQGEQTHAQGWKNLSCLKPHGSVGFISKSPLLQKSIHNSSGNMLNELDLGRILSEKSPIGDNKLSVNALNRDKIKTHSDNFLKLPKILHEKYIELSISLPRINFNKIEPLCMVHELYRCFCKGKFLTQTSDINIVSHYENTTIHKTKNISNDCRETGFTGELKPYGKKYNECECNCSLDASSLDNSHIISNEGKYNRRQPKPHKNEELLKELLKEDMQPASVEKNKSKLINNNIAMNTSSKSEIETSQYSDDKITSESVHSKSGSLDKSKTTLFSLWLRKQYNHVKSLTDAGFEIVLDKPYPNNLKLFPYPSLKKRYEQEKNYFLVYKDPPYRACIVIDPFLEEFKNCINIKDLAISELQQYSDTIKHIVLNSELNDSYLLLKGFQNYWEILGLVSKCVLPTAESQIFSNKSKCMDMITTGNSTKRRYTQKYDIYERISNPEESKKEKCKWLHMNIANDFKKLRFTPSNVHITFTNIISAINVARSTKKCVFITLWGRSTGNKFGIYALPKMIDNSILIGPYGLRKKSCIEIDQTICVSPEEETRGKWISISSEIDLRNDSLFYLNDFGTYIENKEEPIRTEMKNTSDIIKRARLQSPEKSSSEVQKPIVIKPNKLTSLRPIKSSSLSSCSISNSCEAKFRCPIITSVCSLRTENSHGNQHTRPCSPHLEALSSNMKMGKNEEVHINSSNNAIAISSGDHLKIGGSQFTEML